MRSAFDKGREAACVRFGIKLARTEAPFVPEPIPRPPMSAAPTGPSGPTSWASFNAGARQHVDQGASGIGNLHTAQPTPAVTSMRPQAAGAGGAASRFKMPSLGWKGTLGLMGVGALGAGAYAMHKNNQRDLNRERLVYAPMQGGFS